MPKSYKLERIDIPDSSRVVKDWFATREQAEEAIPAIKAHIASTGQTHTCFCHTHTKPPENAEPVYIGEVWLPERYLKQKQFFPCPCCWAESPKFGHGRIAWFPEERVIRLIGEDCFASMNPEGHERARSAYEEEQELLRNTRFLLTNLNRLPEAMEIIREAMPVAKAVEQMHELLRDRMRKVDLDLFSLVGANGELRVFERASEFRRGTDNMFVREFDQLRLLGRIYGYGILTTKRPRLSSVLERCLERMNEYSFRRSWKEAVDAMTFAQRKNAATALSGATRRAKEVIDEIANLRRFAERVTINTLRNWGQHPGCPFPFNYAHDGKVITFGPSDSRMVGFPIPDDLWLPLREIDFWVPLERRVRR